MSANMQGAVAAAALALVIVLAGAAGFLVHDATSHPMGVARMQEMMDMAHAGDIMHSSDDTMDHGSHGDAP